MAERLVTLEDRNGRFYLICEEDESAFEKWDQWYYADDDTDFCGRTFEDRRIVVIFKDEV